MSNTLNLDLWIQEHGGKLKSMIDYWGNCLMIHSIALRARLSPRHVVLLLLFGSAGLFSGLVQAKTTIENQTKAVIQAQLEAFSQDDSNKAFSYASRNIQVMFGDPATFLEMVKKDYNVVYRPQMVRFLRFAATEELAEHTVLMADRNQILWNVSYRLINTGKEGWKISSCLIEKASSQLI
ncbi:MAG: DUF4864 domain-containing protein [Limnobacter sp.]|nr:DUF4864 domain-containing protein [Limnobacter sp.]